MPDLENLLREELQHEARKVQPELLRPLQVPTRRPSWRPRLLPFTAAAAVIAVITAGRPAPGPTSAHHPSAPPPRGCPPRPARPPPPSTPPHYPPPAPPRAGSSPRRAPRARP